MAFSSIPVLCHLNQMQKRYIMELDGEGYRMTDAMGSHGRIAKQKDGTWKQTHGSTVPPSAITEMGKQIVLNAYDQVVFCEVVLYPDGYNVFFDHQLIGEVNLDENLNWVVSTGKNISKSMLHTIGLEIEKHFH
jgi:hypothetical protein